MKFKSSGHRAFEAADWNEAGRVVAGLKARQAYGRELWAVRSCRMERFGSSFAEFTAFIGRRDATDVIGRNVRFTVRLA